MISIKTQISHYLEDRARAVGGKGFNIFEHKSDLKKFKTTLTRAVSIELNNCALQDRVNFQISGRVGGSFAMVNRQCLEKHQ